MKTYQVVSKIMDKDSKTIKKIRLVEEGNNSQDQFLVSINAANQFLEEGNQCFIEDSKGNRRYVSLFAADTIKVRT